MPQLKDVNATLDTIENKTGGEAKSEPHQELKKAPKKAKWHLGIRSQSKPQDIMNEVFKAMKANNMVCLPLIVFTKFPHSHVCFGLF